MSKVHILAIATLLLALLFAGVAEAGCMKYFFLTHRGCSSCPNNCGSCYGPSQCYPSSCDQGCRFVNGLCIKIIINSAARVGVYGAVAALVSAVAFLVY